MIETLSNPLFDLNWLNCFPLFPLILLPYLYYLVLSSSFMFYIVFNIISIDNTSVLFLDTINIIYVFRFNLLTFVDYILSIWF